MSGLQIKSLQMHCPLGVPGEDWGDLLKSHPAQGLHQFVPISPQLSGKWFYFGSVFRYPEFIEWTKKVHSVFIYFIPNKTEDTVYFREYQTL